MKEIILSAIGGSFLTLIVIYRWKGLKALFTKKVADEKAELNKVGDDLKQAGKDLIK